MSKKPSISIITACYNSTPFIDRIYRSSRAQTYKNFEWICVDDCSTDETVARLVVLEAPGKLGMKVYRLPQNTGGPVALAVGTGYASGEIVIWLDHDDELFPFALETVCQNWVKVEDKPEFAGLFLRAADPSNGQMIGTELPPNAQYSWSELNNRFPDIYDGTVALKATLIKQYATIEEMEGVILNSVILNRLTKNRPFLIGDLPPIKLYHRDNPQSQTMLEHISRKSVSTYAWLIDGADRHFLRSPIRWARHVATFLRFSKQVHGHWFEGLSMIRRPLMRAIVRIAYPLGLLAYWRHPNARVVEIPFFPADLAKRLTNVWQGR